MAFWLKSVRWVALILVVSNVLVIIMSGVLIIWVIPSCGDGNVLIYIVISVASVLRIVAIVHTGMAQKATAAMILGSPDQSAAVDAVVRHERRIKYKKWLYWTRFAMVITVLQLLGAAYLMFNAAKYIFSGETSRDCLLGVAFGAGWKHHSLITLMVLVCFVAFLQCLSGSDVLRWRSFYATQDDAWKAHYREMFDHGIREALCCLGRSKYLSVLEEDEIYSVARLLGDLVAYRASGTGHLELLAGLALLQRHSQVPKPYEESSEASEEHIQEAATWHQFAEAAYTGPLIDLGRNPILFPCVWLYRQGILTPWTRNRRPALEGDNWWRGHAAAFIKCAHLSPGALRHGRVCQGKCEAAYFVLVLHDLNSVVIAVRGTATPEDLITDGLCKECVLTDQELDGLMNSEHVHPDARQRLISTSPHYGHSGIVEAARDLYKKIEEIPGDDYRKYCINLAYDNRKLDSPWGASSILSSLLGRGCECEGYKLRIAGHSLGGAISAVPGMMLYRRYPHLHVYAYGSLPCVDSVVAGACSDFVTSVIYENEFSARLSVGSMLRLRAAALTSLSENTITDTAVVFRLARQFLYVSKYEERVIDGKNPSSDFQSGAITPEVDQDQDQDFPLRKTTNMKDSSDEIYHTDSLDSFTNPFATDAPPSPLGDPVSQFMEAVPAASENGSTGEPSPTEMFLPGLIVHIVRKQKDTDGSLWNGWILQNCSENYGAYIADKENFKDIVVSPSMFLDHLPWRCQYAIQKVLEDRRAQRSLDEAQMV